MKINCIAIDDEPLALEKMKHYIQKISYLNLMAVFDSGINSLEFIKSSKVDLIFLDVQMEDLTGIQLLESLKTKPEVILTTAYDTYALKGFELDVADYLLKPISFERFVKAVDRVYDKLTKKSETAFVINKSNGNESDDYIFVKTEYRIQKVNFEDILFVEGMKDYLRIWTLKERIMTLMSFDKLMKKLPADNFIRVHKSYIIAWSKIESIQRNRIKIADQLIPVGETYRAHFFKLLASKSTI